MTAKNVKKQSDARRIKQMEDVSTRVSLYAQAETTRKLQVKSEMFVVRSPTALGLIPGSVHRSPSHSPLHLSGCCLSRIPHSALRCIFRAVCAVPAAAPA